MPVLVYNKRSAISPQPRLSVRARPRHLGFEALGKGVEILGALLSDRAYSACGFASEGIAAASKAISDVALLGLPQYRRAMGPDKFEYVRTVSVS